jgi:hypothetical protein
MTTATNEAMHADHRTWAMALSQWQDDLALWHRELIQAGEELRQAGAVLDAHAGGLDSHARLLRREAEEVEDHEHLMACVARHQADHDRVAQTGGHDAEAARYARLREAHERLKRYHHQLLAKVSVLAKAVAEPM